jgi:hypothetical protein
LPGSAGPGAVGCRKSGARTSRRHRRSLICRYKPLLLPRCDSQRSRRIFRGRSRPRLQRRPPKSLRLRRSSPCHRDLRRSRRPCERRLRRFDRPQGHQPRRRLRRSLCRRRRPSLCRPLHLCHSLCRPRRPSRFLRLTNRPWPRRPSSPGRRLLHLFPSTDHPQRHPSCCHSLPAASCLARRHRPAPEAHRGLRFRKRKARQVSHRTSRAELAAKSARLLAHCVPRRAAYYESHETPVCFHTTLPSRRWFRFEVRRRSGLAGGATVAKAPSLARRTARK